MKKIKVKTRAELLFPYINIPFHNRLVLAGVVDLRDNHTIENLGNGYIRIHAIDKTKLFK